MNATHERSNSTTIIRANTTQGKGHSRLRALWLKLKMLVRGHLIEGWLFKHQVDRFYLVFGGHIFFQTLRAAAKFDLFTLLAAHKKGLTLSEIAKHLKIEEQPARIMLLGLVSSGILKKRGNKYSNTFLSNTILRSDSKRSVLQYVELEHHVMYKGVHSLYESIVENRNVGLSEFKGTDPTLYQRLGNHPDLEAIFQDAMSELSVQTNKNLVELVDFSQYKRVVDIGGGDGTNAIALCRAYPNLKVTVFDLPPARDIAEANIREAGFADRIDFVEGNCFEDEFPTGADCFLFCHFMTIWSAEKDKALMQKAHKALPQGGAVVVFNMMQHNNGAGPLSAAVGSPYFLAIATGEGMLYSWNEYDSWMREAGFNRVVQQVLPNDHGAIVGRKK